MLRPTGGSGGGVRRVRYDSAERPERIHSLSVSARRCSRSPCPRSSVCWCRGRSSSVEVAAQALAIHHHLGLGELHRVLHDFASAGTGSARGGRDPAARGRGRRDRPPPWSTRLTGPSGGLRVVLGGLLEGVKHASRRRDRSQCRRQDVRRDTHPVVCLAGAGACAKTFTAVATDRIGTRFLGMCRGICEHPSQMARTFRPLLLCSVFSMASTTISMPTRRGWVLSRQDLRRGARACRTRTRRGASAAWGSSGGPSARSCAGGSSWSSGRPAGPGRAASSAGGPWRRGV